MIATDGVLAGGLAYRAVGDGPPVVILPGISGDNADPSGRGRRFALRPFRALTQHFTVYVINRKPGLDTGSTLHDLARHYAGALEQEFAGPVPVVGVSTGGSIAQALAIDYPHLVRRLVLFASACRLSPYGKQVQRTMTEHIRAGRPRRAQAAIGPALAATTLGGWFFSALTWFVGGRMTPRDASDLLITVKAEDRFDAAPDLDRVTAETLIIGGGRDRFYSPELFRETAERIPRARLRLYPAKGHVGTIGHRPALQEILRFLEPSEPRTEMQNR